MRLFILLTVIISFITALGCRKTVSSHRGIIADASKTGSGIMGSCRPGDVGTLCLSLAIVDELVVSLHDAGYLPAQVQAIRHGALSVIVESQSALRLTENLAAPKFEELVPLIVKGALGAMFTEAAAMDESATQLVAAGTITSSVFKSLGNKMDDLPVTARLMLPGAIAEKAIPALSGAQGLSGSLLNQGIGVIVSSAVANLSAAGFKREDLGSVVNSVAKSSIIALADAGISVNTMSFAIETVVSQSVYALSRAGAASATECTDLSAGITRTAIESLKGAGLTDSKIVNEATKAIAKGTMTGIGGLQMQNAMTASDVKIATSTITKQAVETLYQQSKIDGTSFSSIQTNSFSQGVVQGLSKSGWSSADVSQVTVNITNGISSALAMATDLVESVAEFVTAATSSTANAISAFATSCTQDGGSWDDLTKICSYPQSAVEAPIMISNISKLIAGKGERIEIHGLNLKPTMKVALAGVALSDVKVENDSVASFSVPEGVAFGLSDLKVEQGGASYSTKFFALSGSTSFPLSTIEPAGVCEGVKYYDASGTLQTGTRVCTAGGDMKKADYDKNGDLIIDRAASALTADSATYASSAGSAVSANSAATATMAASAMTAQFALGKMGTTIASNSIIDIPADGSFFEITGNKEINGINIATPGRRVSLYLSGNIRLVHSAANPKLLLKGRTSFVGGAGDIIEFIALTDGWREVSRDIFRCGMYGSRAACESRSCYFTNNGNCRETPLTGCSAYDNNWSGCNSAGCYFADPLCSNTPVCDATFSPSQCIGMGCHWHNSTSSCSSTPNTACSAYDGDMTSCETALCNFWSNNTCNSIYPHHCSYFNHAEAACLSYRCNFQEASGMCSGPY